eukprot:403357512
MRQLIRSEFLRYYEKGWGLFFAIAHLLILLIGCPAFGRYIWPKVQDFIKRNNIDEQMFLNLYTVIFSTSWYFIVNGFFLIIYKLNHPLIEKYKVTTELWPWIFHTPFFYKRFHKIHHQYTISVGICAEYCHPVEFIFGNSIPFTIPCLLLGAKMHAYTYMLWGAFRVANTVLGHSGYDFPFIFSELLPFNSTTSYHDYHHSANSK